MRKLTFDEVKEYELQILVKFDRLCRENDLSYCLAYGSALGARRHKGFIPWDDDIDVYMPRADYERLYELFGDAKDETCRLVTSRNGTSPYQFFKMMDKRTVTYEKYIGDKYPLSVWIDIFPLDRIWMKDPKYEADKKRLLKLTWERSLRVADPTVGPNVAVKAVKRIGGWAMRNLSVEEVNRRIDDASREPTSRIPEDVAKSEIGWWTGVADPEYRCPDAMLFPFKPVEFEGRSFFGPARIDDYLAYRYGDWQTLPPEDQRFTHFPDVYLKD